MVATVQFNGQGDGDAGADWYRLPAADVVRRFDSDIERGLDPTAAAERLKASGRNEIQQARGRSLLHMFGAQFTDFMILVLIAAAVISGIVGEPADSIAIVVIVVLNAVIGAVQEYRAERAVEALRRMAAPEARVLRGGVATSVPSDTLVPGDIVLLQAGDVVPADLRLVDTHRLRHDESALTGESEPVEKSAPAVDTPGLAVADRRNMGFKGTLVVNGRAAAVVTETGMATELGQIAALLREQEAARTPLQVRMARFGKRLAVAVLAICAVVFATGLMRGEPTILMFLTAVSLAVAAIPEALPAVISVSLALGARKMTDRNALIRRLPAVETLGSVSYICTDKTGTLTENRMTVDAVWIDGDVQRRESGFDATGATARRLFEAMALNNDAAPDGDTEVTGEPTEVALYRAADGAGFRRQDLERQLPRVGELPFDSDRKRMTTVHRTDTGERVAFMKGAPEVVLERCTAMDTDGAAKPIDTADILAEADRLAAQGFRVLALAWRAVDGGSDLSDADGLERDMRLLGLAALIDPPRPEAAEAVATCIAAGITPVMITGDHPSTAHAIALRLGIVDDGGGVLTGTDLAGLDEVALGEMVEDVRVYARVTPAQKIEIVRALQERGEFTAMTGDGVNDAPALKRAEIGVAMGRKGTEVAREAADLVLLDDNFATIVAAVREGRRIFDNIRKFIKYTMTSNAGEIWTLLLAPFLGLPIPLLPIHILWINLVTDGLPGLALAAEPEERGIMQRPPRPPNESIFAHGIGTHILWVGLLIGGVSIFAQAWAIERGSDAWQTMVFTVLTFAQLANVLVIRSERESLFSIGLFTNLPVLGAVLLTIALQLAVIYLPVLQPIFRTQPLDGTELLVCFTLPLLVFVAVEIEKWLVRRGILYRS